MDNEPIPIEKLNEYLNQTVVMESESKKYDVIIKRINGGIFGYNKTRKCLFEIINSQKVKFYK